MSRKRLKWSIGTLGLVACVTAAIVIVVVTRPDDIRPANGSAAVVTDQGVTLTIDGITVQGPPGAAPPGTTLTATRGAELPAGRAAAMFSGTGEKLELSLGGLQSAKPLTVTFPVTGAVPEGAAATVLTRPSDTTDTHLIPATFDPAKRTISAEVDHLSGFWPGFLDFGKLTGMVKDFLGQTTGITSAKPACAGKAATGKDNTTVSLSGDTNGAPVWPCVRLEDGQAVVTLRANSPLPWRVRAAPSASLDPPGTVDISKAIVLAGYDTLVKNRPYSEGLLVPGVEMTYRLPGAQLPGTVAGQADSGTYLGMALLFGFEEALEMFNIDFGQLSTNADALRCLGDAVEAANIGTRPSVADVAKLAKAVLSCASTVARALIPKPGPVNVVIGILTTGVSLIAAGIQGVVLTLTGKDTFTIKIITNAPADPNVIRFDGIGEFTLRLTAKELLVRGYVNKGNLYQGMNAPCVSYAKEGQPLSFSVESKTGRVLAIQNSGGNQSLRTQVGGIRVGSTLAQLRKAFASHRIEEHFSSDFGQGSNGVIVNGSGGSMGISLDDASASDYASGRVKITHLNGVGLPDQAPTNMEDGC